MSRLALLHHGEHGESERHCYASGAGLDVHASAPPRAVEAHWR